MKNIKRIYRRIEQKNPQWIPYMTFVDIARKSNFRNDKIVRMFDALVAKNEYMESREILLV